MEVLCLGKDVLFEGMIQGTVSSIPSRTGGVNKQLGDFFTLELDKEYRKIPNDIVVYVWGRHQFLVRPGDRVKIRGEIVEEDLFDWNVHRYFIRAKHLYNETLKFGF